MPGAMNKWIGIAAQIEGWLQQDRAEQEMQLAQLEGMMGAGARLTQIQGAQATERRTQALFPGEQELQQQKISGGALELAGMERAEASAEEVDAAMREMFGMSMPVAEAIKNRLGIEVLTQTQKSRLQQQTPRLTGQKEGLELEGDVSKLQARRAAQAPIREGFAEAEEAGVRTAQAQYTQRVLDLKRERQFATTAVNVEEELLNMLPTVKKAEFLNTLADIQKKTLDAADTPAGRDAAKRLAYAKYGLDYDKAIIRNDMIDRGDIQKLPLLLDNIRLAEAAIANLQTQKNDINGAMAFMMTFLDDNPYIANRTAATTEENPRSVDDIIRPLQDFVKVNKGLLWEHHEIKYDDLLGREFAYTTGDLDELVGRMIREGGPNNPFRGFKGDKAIREDITDKLVRLINGKNFDVWERFWNRHKDAMVERWGEENWFHGLDVLRRVLWEQGKNANLSGTPPHATFIGPRRPIQTPSLQPTRQGELEAVGVEGIGNYIDRIMDEASDTMNLQGLKREFESLLQE